jgi:hypothetical protein
MKQLVLTFLLASAAVALATVTTSANSGKAAQEAQTAGAICCDEPPPQCWPNPCDPPEQGRNLKPVRK